MQGVCRVTTVIKQGGPPNDASPEPDVLPGSAHTRPRTRRRQGAGVASGPAQQNHPKPDRKPSRPITQPPDRNKDRNKDGDPTGPTNRPQRNRANPTRPTPQRTGSGSGPITPTHGPGQFFLLCLDPGHLVRSVVPCQGWPKAIAKQRAAPLTRRRRPLRQSRDPGSAERHSQTTRCQKPAQPNHAQPNPKKILRRQQPRHQFGQLMHIPALMHLNDLPISMRH